MSKSLNASVRECWECFLSNQGTIRAAPPRKVDPNCQALPVASSPLAVRARPSMAPGFPRPSGPLQSASRDGTTVANFCHERKAS